MTMVTKAGLAAATLAVAALITPVGAADLGGSIKDGYAAPLPVVHSGGAGPCYFRADVGGSVSRDPDVKWPVYSRFTEVFEEIRAGETERVETGRNVTDTFVGDRVTGVNLQNTWLADVGMGCGSGSRGLRGEAVFGFRGDRKLQGEPALYTRESVVEFNDENSPDPPTRTPFPQDFEDPLHTSIKSYTLMFNAYYDMGNFSGFVPYVGAGVGAAYHIVDEVFFTGNPNLLNRIEGDKTLSFAWSVMAGVGYQISDRAILDFGYRYIDMGNAKSGRVDNAGFVNPVVRINDIDAHEFKAGLRYHFGGDRAAIYEPMK